MKIIQRYIVAFGVLILSVCSLEAQEAYGEQIDATPHAVEKREGESRITMEVLLDRLEINKNHLLVLTPVISSLKSGETVELPPMVILGKLRDKMIRRPYTWKGKPVIDTKAAYRVVRKNGTPQTIVYEEVIPFEKWQQHARLWMKTEVMGCAECDLGEGEMPLLARIYAEPYQPVYKVSYITPEAEPVKQRSETYSAYFNYRQGRSELLPDFGNNAAELDKVDRVIREVQGDKDLTFTDIAINGYASPEGTYDYNMKLSEKRANTFADYLTRKYGMNRSQFKVNWHGEDWEGLRAAIEKEEFADKEVVLRIIDNVAIHDGREKRIMELSGGNTYRRMLEKLFPPLRRNDYTVGFIARAFNVDEAKRLVKTKPGLLSLNEMFLVAQTYPRESADFKELFEVAVRLFPHDPVSNINAAATDLERDDAQAAYRRLEKLKETPQAWNNLGVALAKLKRYDEAKQYFDRAAAQGDDTAKANADELRKLLESL